MSSIAILVITILTMTSKGNVMDKTELTPGFFVLRGAVNTGVLVRDGHALLFDCCDSVTPKRLEEIGVQTVDMILCTQHRRPNVAGAYAFVERGKQLIVSRAEQSLFEDVDAYWNDWKNRWHLYHAQPGPQVLATRMPVARGVGGGDEIPWRGVTIRVLDTPGATDGSVSYLVDVNGTTFCFSGDVLYGPGQLWDVYSLQKGFGAIGDYHGFLGNRTKLVSSLHKLAASGAQVLVPSHGDPIRAPKAATELLENRLNELWRNYTAITALNHYFPHLLDDTKDDPQRMKPAHTSEPPDWIQRVAYTSFAVISDTGAALLIDCGHDSVLHKLDEWKNEKKISAVEGCWVTHYHDDHVDALQRVANGPYGPIMTDVHLAEIIEHPQRFFLPCIAPCGAPVAKATRDGESWPWREYKLTAWHFPGQTFYHAGLLIEGHGKKAFFAGDSGAPTGIDDYTCGNRVFLGENRGFRRCFAIWRECRPDYIFNEHQDRAFSFTPEELDLMDANLAKREQLLAAMLPWEDPNFGVDEWWARTYPYEQEACPGGVVGIDVQFTNHASKPACAEIEPVAPEGWSWDKARSSSHITVGPRTDGWVDASTAHPDGVARAWLHVPDTAKPGRYTIPFRVTWGNRYFGQYRHAIVTVR